MSNMPYARFQNTRNDLRDCLDRLHDADLGPEEDAARRKLVKLCKDIVDEWEDYYGDESAEGETA